MTGISLHVQMLTASQSHGSSQTKEIAMTKLQIFDNPSNLLGQQEVDFRFRLIGDRHQVAGHAVGALDGNVDEGAGPVEVTLERFPDGRGGVVAATQSGLPDFS
jgi:hypothetical protein